MYKNSLVCKGFTLLLKVEVLTSGSEALTFLYSKSPEMTIFWASFKPADILSSFLSIFKPERSLLLFYLGDLDYR